MINEKQIIYLSEDDAKLFLETMQNPPPPNEKLKDAFDLYENSVQLTGISGKLIRRQEIDRRIDREQFYE